MSEVIIREITFSDILPIWTNQLWPNRQSPIKSMSSMTYDGEYDMSIYDNHTPYFVGADIDGKLIGCNSGHNTRDGYYRTRGIWVDPAYRGKGIAHGLFTKLEEQAKREECEFMWSIPRRGSVNAYVKFGFALTSDWFDEKMEFGPNCMALKRI